MLSRREMLKYSGAIAASAMFPARSFAEETSVSQDMALLRQAMDIHPGALRYLNPVALNAGIAKLGEAMSKTDDLAARYLAFSRFLSTVKCGHTYANFYNQSEAVQAALFDRQTRLPFAFRWLGDEMIVTSARDGLDLPAGSTVKAINGVPAKAMLNRLLQYTRADGEAMGKRRALLEVQDRASIEYFDVFHGLIYGVPENGLHKLDSVEPNGAERTLSAPALSLAERKAMRAESVGDIGPEDPLWQFSVRDNIGILTMQGWSTYKTKWDWQSWLMARLDEAGGLNGLIIDNRRNEGGSPEVGLLILQRVLSEPVRLPEMRRLVRFRTFPEALRPHAGTWDQSFYSIGEDAKAIGRGFYELPEAQQLTEIGPAGNGIDVPIMLLTSPTNSSASFTFARIAKSTGRMTLMGEPTGGNRRGINGDGFFFTTLPHCGIEFDLPMVGVFPTTPQPDEGVMPDIEVSETARDIANGYDRTLELALRQLG